MVKKFLLVLVLIAGVVFYWGYSKIQALPEQLISIDQSEILAVPKGSSANQLADNLESLGWIEDSRLLKALYRLDPALTDIKAGEYLIEPGMTVAELFSSVVSGASIQYRITLIEGSTVKEILAQLRSNTYLSQSLESTDAQSLVQELELDFPSAEGLFLAETYQFERGTSDKALLLRAHQMLLEELESHWQQSAEGLPLNSAYEALILASIIEKETGLAEERPEISGVFIRRLNRGMRLQTDPTVIYGMGDRYNGNIRRKDLREPTPFNTYVISGLPPTPIATVGPEAIEASVNPKDGKTLFFVAKGDGSHQFSETLEQHNRAVREYQLKRRDDYRSSPGQ